MNATGQHADPLDEYVAALTAALRGPAPAKSRMIEEMRDGLADTAAAYAGAGMPSDRAAHQALREFGTVDELLPSCQRELTIAQARHTARAVALTAPLLMVCWYLARTVGDDQGWQLPIVARLLAVLLACVAIVAALLAAATLAATSTLGRWLPTPRRLPLVVAWVGTTASAAMAATALALAVASALAEDWPLLAFAGGLAAASHAVVAASARACRRCARLPATPAAVSRQRG